MAKMDAVSHLVSCLFLKALGETQRRCEELEEALNSRCQVLEMLQQEVSSADQQKQVEILLFWMPVICLLEVC